MYMKCENREKRKRKKNGAVDDEHVLADNLEPEFPAAVALDVVSTKKKKPKSVHDLDAGLDTGIGEPHRQKRKYVRRADKSVPAASIATALSTEAQPTAAVAPASDIQKHNSGDSSSTSSDSSGSASSSSSDSADEDNSYKSPCAGAGDVLAGTDVRSNSSALIANASQTCGDKPLMKKRPRLPPTTPPNHLLEKARGPTAATTSEDSAMKKPPPKHLLKKARGPSAATTTEDSAAAVLPTSAFVASVSAPEFVAAIPRSAGWGGADMAEFVAPQPPHRAFPLSPSKSKLKPAFRVKESRHINYPSVSLEAVSNLHEDPVRQEKLITRYRGFDELWFKEAGQATHCDQCERWLHPASGTLQGAPGKPLYAQFRWVCYECDYSGVLMPME